MARSVVLRPSATKDIDEQTLYFALYASELVAERFTAMLQNTFTRIEENPELGAPWETRHSMLQGIRYWLVEKFRSTVVFYRVNAEAIEIIRLLHSSQKLEHHLLEGID